jgi:hypothetical protein
MCKTKEETIKILEEAADIFRSSRDELLTLDNYKNAFTSSEFMDRIKQLADVFSIKRKKGAVIGVRGLNKMLLNTYNIFVKEKISPFDSKEVAVKYLVS